MTHLLSNQMPGHPIRPTILITILFLGYAVAIQTQEGRLLEDLFDDYKPTARPVQNASAVPTVYISFVLSQVDHLSLKDETLVTSGYIRVTWYDERLVWDPALYDGIETLVVSPVMVWLPDFVLYNRGGSDRYTEEHYSLYRVTVSFDGQCKWTPGGEFKSKCSTNVTYFPFDKQQCRLKFSSWMYPSTMVNLTHGPCAQDEILENFTGNGEWDIEGVRIELVDVHYGGSVCRPELVSFQEIMFVLDFRRKSLFYTVNIVAPSAILAILVFMVLLLPPGSGDKMSMGVTLLLSITIFMLMVSENVPHTSEAVPVIVMYLLGFMILSALTIIWSVLIRVIQQHKKAAELPECVFKSARKLNKSVLLATRKKHDSSDTGSGIHVSRNDIMMSPIRSETSPTPSPSNEAPENDLVGIMREILKEVVAHADRSRAADHKEELLRQWRAVAVAWDTIFFIVVVLVFVLISSIVLCLPRME